MKRICAWCKKDLGSTINPDGTVDAPITHGICSECAKKELAFLAKPLKSFLDQFSKPVFLITSEGKIVTGNSAGYSFLHKNPDEVDGKLGGDAFGCKYADLPGGCGNTVHCKTCAIRLAVSDTLLSGKNKVKIPAYPDLFHITGETRVQFIITTEQIGEAVLLRIDEVSEEMSERGDR